MEEEGLEDMEEDDQSDVEEEGMMQYFIVVGHIRKKKPAAVIPQD